MTFENKFKFISHKMPRPSMFDSDSDECEDLEFLNTRTIRDDKGNNRKRKSTDTIDKQDELQEYNNHTSSR